MKRFPACRPARGQPKFPARISIRSFSIRLADRRGPPPASANEERRRRWPRRSNFSTVQLIQKKLADKQNRFHRQLGEGRPQPEVIEQLYRAAVCRLPTDAEMQAALEHIVGKEKPSDGLEDVCWALLNTEEFLTQH